MFLLIDLERTFTQEQVKAPSCYFSLPPSSPHPGSRLFLDLVGFTTTRLTANPCQPLCRFSDHPPAPVRQVPEKRNLDHRATRGLPGAPLLLTAGGFGLFVSDLFHHERRKKFDLFTPKPDTRRISYASRSQIIIFTCSCNTDDDKPILSLKGYELTPP